MRKCFFFIALATALLNAEENPLSVANYRFVSREFAVSLGEASSPLHNHQFLSREFTVGVGEATDAFHTRSICSREFTVGIGNEIVDIWPFQEKLAGFVTLQNGSRFLQDMEHASISIKIQSGGQTLATLENQPLESFTYLWNTSSLPDGIYTVSFTVSRPEHADINGSRSYTLVNQHYEGRENRTMEVRLHPGWNLISMPFCVNSDVFPQNCTVFSWDAAHDCYYKAVGEILAGQPLWFFSPSEQIFSCISHRGITAPPALPSPLKTGWNLVGVCGDQPLVLDENFVNISAIFQWNGTTYKRVSGSLNGSVLLPGVAYWIYYY